MSNESDKLETSTSWREYWLKEKQLEKRVAQLERELAAAKAEIERLWEERLDWVAKTSVIHIQEEASNE